MIKQNISDQNPSGDKTTVKGDNKNNKNTNTAKKADNTKKNQPKTQKLIKDHKRYNRNVCQRR